MLYEITEHTRDMIDQANSLLSTYFQKPIHFSRIVQLSEPERRNLILRLEIDMPTSLIPRSIILKKTEIEKQNVKAETEEAQLSRFAHDWAGLEFLTQIGGNHAPYFYSGSLEHQFILFEDLGLHSSLVGALTRSASNNNVGIAETALEKYVKRLGKMHADTAGHFSLFSKILTRIYPKVDRYHYFPDLSEIICLFEKLDIFSNELESEIRDIVDFAQSKNDFHVFLHGDICPDNVFFVGDDIRFIDFEFGDFGNAFIDGTYLRMFMPSCWCSKKFPESVINKMESIYREELKRKILITSNEEEYNKNLTYACAYWVIRNLQNLDEMELIDREWVGASGLTDADSLWDPSTNTARPRVLSRLKAFVSLSNKTGHFPQLSHRINSLLSFLKNKWPETNELDLYPVFNGNFS